MPSVRTHRITTGRQEKASGDICTTQQTVGITLTLHTLPENKQDILYESSCFEHIVLKNTLHHISGDLNLYVLHLNPCLYFLIYYNLMTLISVILAYFYSKKIATLIRLID